MPDRVKHYRQIDVLLQLTAEELDAARPLVHDELLQLMQRHGGVEPNEFVDNDQQAADYAAQNDGMAVTLLLTRAIRLGLQQMLPSGYIEDLYFRPLPDDYKRPGS